MKDIKRMRLVCGLRQIDTWAGTGISPNRLSAAERGLIQLSESEEKLLRKFLRQRWESLQELENPEPASPPIRVGATA